LEANHLGGQRHAPAISLPYCSKDHADFHANCRRAGVDFRKQPDKVLGQVQALKAHLVGLWMVIQEIERVVKQKSKLKGKKK
jgi:hypothetical protein